MSGHSKCTMDLSLHYMLNSVRLFGELALAYPVKRFTSVVQ